MGSAHWEIDRAGDSGAIPTAADVPRGFASEWRYTRKPQVPRH
jgi:hypothetical protein